MTTTNVPQALKRDFELAESCIRSILGPDLLVARTTTDGTIITDRCNQIWQDTFCINAEKTYETILWGLSTRKDYAKLVDPMRMEEDLNNISCCVGRTTKSFLRVINAVQSLKKQAFAEPREGDKHLTEEQKGVASQKSSQTPKKSMKKSVTEFRFNPIAFLKDRENTSSIQAHTPTNCGTPLNVFKESSEEEGSN